ncbi:MAG: phosphoadenosine phosphosulfate reductase [Pseudomonadota bacterium]
MADREEHLRTPLGGLSRADWLTRAEDIAEYDGYFEPVGKQHSAIFIDRDPSVLIVSFEELDTVRLSDELGHPVGFHLARTRDWSHLCIMAEGETWYRDRALYGYFDRLIDDGFFEDFDRVIFYGAEMGAYGAAAFSVASPGSTVIAIQPVATLEPDRTVWDPRYADRRRLDFTTRYGYGPEMVEAAAKAYVIFDPQERLDAIHAALYDRETVTHLRCRHLGDRIALEFERMGILQKVLEAAGDGTLDARSFFTLYRERRTNAAYLRRLLAELEGDDRPYLAALLCRNAVQRLNQRRFREGLRRAQAQLVERGITFTWPQLISAE